MTIRDSYAVLLVPAPAVVADEVLDLPGGTEVGEAAEVLDAVFALPGRPAEIDLLVGGEPMGRVSRDRLLGPGRQFGDGDGATLPGDSFKYQLIRLRCPVCGAEVLRIHLDDRDPPGCGSGHGPMCRVTPDG